MKNLRRHRIRVDENIGASSRARRSRASRTLSIEVTVRFGQDRKLRIRSAASGVSGCRGVSRSSSQNTGCFLSPVGTGPANRAPLSRFPLSRAGSRLGDRAALMPAGAFSATKHCAGSIRNSPAASRKNAELGAFRKIASADVDAECVEQALAGVEGDRLHHLVGVARGGRHRHRRQPSAPTAFTKWSTSGNTRTVPASFSSSSRFCLRSA